MALPKSGLARFSTKDSKTLTIEDPKIAFEPLSTDHFTLLHKWIWEPHVWQWWGEGKPWTFDEKGAIHHVMLRGNQGRPILYSEGDRVLCCLLIQEVMERYGQVMKTIA